MCVLWRTVGKPQGLSLGFCYIPSSPQIGSLGNILDQNRKATSSLFENMHLFVYFFNASTHMEVFLKFLPPGSCKQCLRPPKVPATN